MNESFVSEHVKMCPVKPKKMDFSWKYSEQSENLQRFVVMEQGN